MALTAVPVSTVDAAGCQFGVHQGAELRVDGGQHLGQLLDLGHGQAAGGQRLGHLQADVPAPTITALAGPVSSRVRMTREGVVHRVQQVHPVRRAQRVEPGDRRADGDGARADDQLVVAR